MNKDNFRKASDALKEACQTLFAQTDIDFCSYARFSKNRNFEFVISHPEVQAYLLNNHYYLNQMELRELDEYASGFIYDTFSAVNEGSLMLLQEIDENFGLNHFLSYQEKNKDYCDFFSFGARSSKGQVHQFYLSHLPFLKKYSRLALPLFREIIASHDHPRLHISYNPKGGRY